MLGHKKEVLLSVIIISIDLAVLLRHSYNPIRSETFSTGVIQIMIVLSIMIVLTSFFNLIWMKYSSLKKLSKRYSKNMDKFERRYRINKSFLNFITKSSFVLGIMLIVTSLALYLLEYNFIHWLILSVVLFNLFTGLYILNSSMEIIHNKIFATNNLR